MVRVLCRLPNAGELINSVTFFPEGACVISEFIDRATANRFLEIPGYELVAEDKTGGQDESNAGDQESLSLDAQDDALGQELTPDADQNPENPVLDPASETGPDAADPKAGKAAKASKSK